VNVTVRANGHRDGWLSVDPDDWLAERGEIDDDLTASLRTYLEQGDSPHDGHASTAAVLAWVARRWPGSATSGLYGDGPACEVNLVNAHDTLLADDIGYVFFVVQTSASEHHRLLVVQSDHLGCYVAPTVYRTSVSDDGSLLDYTHASGGCVTGHGWFTDDAVRMYPAEPSGPGCQVRIADRVRVPFGDIDRAYVACPECGRAVRFQNTVW
jgi:hypothetical protein